MDIPLPATRADEFQDSEIGKLRVFTLTHESGKTSYAVLYIDYPDGTFARRDLSVVFDSLIREQVKSARATLRSAATCQLGDFAGREAIVDEAN